MLLWVHFILYTVDNNVYGTDVVPRLIIAGLHLIGIQHRISLIICLQEEEREFIFNHVNDVFSVTALVAYDAIAHFVLLLFCQEVY